MIARAILVAAVMSFAGVEAAKTLDYRDFRDGCPEQDRVTL